MNATITLNQQLNGIEITFSSKPTAVILDALKAVGFRWHNEKRLWYARQNEKTLEVAEQIGSGAVTAQGPQNTPQTPQGIRFMYNGMKQEKTLYKGWYSMGRLTNAPEGTITIYASDYKSFPHIEGLTIENNTDSMTDYFEKDRIRVTPDNPYYEAVKAAYGLQEAKRKARYEKKYGKPY